MVWLEAARRIADRHAAEVQLPDGSWTSRLPDLPSEAEETLGLDMPDDEGVLLDAFTASMLVQVHDALSPANAERFAGLPLVRAADVGWRLVAKAST